MNTKHLNFQCEYKALDDTTGTFEGYGSIFGNKDSYGDVVMPGAFVDSLSTMGMPVMLWQHDADDPIGIYTECYEDDKGLYVKGQINLDVQQGKEAYSLLKQGAIKGMSIGYLCKQRENDETTGVTFLKKIDLYEISIVTFPANRLANVTAVKGMGHETIRDFEDFLREAGYSRAKAKTIAASGFNAASNQREADSTQIMNALSELKRIIENGTGNSN